MVVAVRLRRLSHRGCEGLWEANPTLCWVTVTPAAARLLGSLGNFNAELSLVRADCVETVGPSQTVEATFPGPFMLSRRYCGCIPPLLIRVQTRIG